MVSRGYSVVRSDRRTLAIEITKTLEVLVRAPKRATDEEIRLAVEKHAAWIEKNIEVRRLRNEARTAYELTDGDISELTALAKKVIPPKVEHYAKLMGVKPKSVKITSAQSRFGSCSGQNGLCFSYILMRFPEEAIDYVVVHELAHIKHHNHSKSFYALVGKYLPDYKAREKLLKNGGA